MPDILHWDGCAQIDKSKKKGLIKSSCQRSWWNSEENRSAGGGFRGLSKPLAGGEKATRSRAEYLLWLVSACLEITALEWDTAKLSSCGREGDPGLLWLARSPNAGQYFQSLGDCSSASLQKGLRLPSTSLPFPYPCITIAHPHVSIRAPHTHTRRVALSSP